MKDDREIIVDMIKKITKEFGYERGVVCGIDCLLQWTGDDLEKTVDAWKTYSENKQKGDGLTETIRHGMWVPAIPL